MPVPSHNNTGTHFITLGEACHACGLKPCQLRYWETEIPALKPAKHRGSRRLYSPQEVNTLLKVKQWLLEEGLSFSSVNQLLPPPASMPSVNPVILELQEVIKLLKSE